MTDEILKTGLKAGRPYLGTPSVVEGVLRGYLLELKDFRTKQLLEGDDPRPHVSSAADRLQAIFYGQDKEYLASGWNTEDSLGKFLVKDCGIGGDTKDAVRRIGVRIARDFYKILTAFEADDITDEKTQEKINALVKLFIQALLGYRE